MLADGMNDLERPVFVSTLTVTADAMTRRHPDLTADRDRTRILRSVLMKPESESHIGDLHARLEELAGQMPVLRPAGVLENGDGGGVVQTLGRAPIPLTTR